MCNLRLTPLVVLRPKKLAGANQEPTKSQRGKLSDWPNESLPVSVYLCALGQVVVVCLWWLRFGSKFCGCPCRAERERDEQM